MAYGAYIAMRAKAEVRLIRQTQAELRANLQTNNALVKLWQAKLDKAKHSLEVNQMLLMLFCLHENSVMSTHPYASLALPTSRSCMTQSDLLTEKQHAI